MKGLGVWNLAIFWFNPEHAKHHVSFSFDFKGPQPTVILQRATIVEDSNDRDIDLEAFAALQQLTELRLRVEFERLSSPSGFSIVKLSQKLEGKTLFPGPLTMLAEVYI